MQIQDSNGSEALERILSSARFQRAQRRTKFLRFIAEESFAGRADQLKEYLIGTQVFNKPETYDPRTDSTVRTEATKLRAALREYYAGEGAGDPVILSLPLGGYRILAEPREAPAPGSKPRAKWKPIAAGAAAVLTLTVGVWSVSYRALPPVTLRPLTAFPGSELRPQISPDGKRVVFAWNGPQKDNFEIYTMPVEGGTPTRLTDNPARDVYSTWSPDGKWIAWARDPGPKGSVWMVPAGGGRGRKLIDGEAFSLTFTPDGKEIAYVDRGSPRAPWRVLTVSLASGERRSLTSPPEGILGDAYPAFSPDGKWLAFVRLTYGPASEVYVQRAGGGEPVQITKDNRNIFGICWNSEGEILFSSDRMGLRTLWKVKAPQPFFGAWPARMPEPTRVDGAGEDALHPHFRNGRIAYQRTSQVYNIRIRDLTRNTPAERVAASTRWDVTPAISPDGRNLAFSSDRTGNMELWRAGIDGSNPMRLTSQPDAYSRMPQWSPDGREIAFEVRANGHAPAIYAIPAEGGSPRLVSASPAGDRRPMWSEDGAWIYFRSMRSGNDGVWKIPAKGGNAVLVETGAVEAGEAGGSLIVCRSNGGLFRNGLNLAQFGCDNRWAAAGNSVAWLEAGLLHLLDVPTGHRRDLELFPGAIPDETAPLSISADGHIVALSSQESLNTDAMLIERR